MGTGIGKYCKRCGEQLNYDDGFEDGFCNRCYHIVKFENRKLSEQPEKQEEWGEIDKDIWYEIGGKRYVSINGEEYVRTKDISQLLSERTFSKEELRLLNAYLSLALPEYNNFDKETKMHEDMDKLHKILEKISKLSNEKENE